MVVTAWRDIDHESIVTQLIGLWNSNSLIVFFYEFGDLGLKEEWEQNRIFKSEFFVLHDFFSLNFT